jgi:threonine dehydratase
VNTSTQQRPLSADYVDAILSADVYSSAIETPLDRAPRLSARLGNDISLKREDLQPVFSFKIRGAQNKIAQLDDAAAQRGVICSSAGNHAQGVALAARNRGIRAVIVMPENTPVIKIDAVRALGGDAVLHGKAYDDAFAYAQEIAQREGLEFVHPFADPAVIAGQGTIAVELARQWRELPDAVFVPVGGGGLIAGIGAWLKQSYPSVKVIGVEPFEACAMHDSLKAGRLVKLDHVGTFADGVAVRQVSERTFALAQEVVDEIVLVDTDEICAAIKDIFEDSRVITEPAGALAVAGIKRYVESNGAQKRNFIAINSGANMNFDRLRHVSERAEIGEHREALLAVRIPEHRGAFLEFCELIGRRNVTEFNYRFNPGDEAQIFVGVSMSDARQEAPPLIESLRGEGYDVQDLSDNEVAKLHIRHMVGGHVPALDDECVYRFEFPENPGALHAFLSAIGDNWNISLFHYRNHGSDYGRVLAGVQVPQNDRGRFAKHLETLGYAYYDETDNPAYHLFLA